ncbi:hypothetical protein PM082_018396 [Marasmius tenuissimus]|nr:hypothetical protein PM082_018396 [Marasmius tenuissimus]
MRPCTLHHVVTLENSVCHGSHFYTASTMSDTVAGIYHTFLHQYHATNQNEHHHRMTLARMICAWEDALYIKLFGTLQFSQSGFLPWPERYAGKKLSVRLEKVYLEARAAGDRVLDWLKSARHCRDTPPAHRLLAIGDSSLSQQLLVMYNAMAKLSLGSCDASIIQSTFKDSMMDDLKRLPSVHKPPVAFFPAGSSSLPGFPLPPTDISTYSWENAYRDQEHDGTYVIWTRVQAPKTSELFVDSSRD